MNDITEITGIEPAHMAVEADFDVNAVAVEVVNDEGRGFQVLLGPASAAEVALRLLGRLSELVGVPDQVARAAVAQHLIRIIVSVGGRKATWIATELGVSDSVLSCWHNGKTVPSPRRVHQLRELPRQTLRAWQH
jgi:hypothetical protein